MRIERKALLYDIANLAYTVADTGDLSRHMLHQVRDICQDGNIDRVNAVINLGLSKVRVIMIPVKKLHLPPEIKSNIKETIHEYLVCLVLADWLGITLPEAADVWKHRAEACFSALKERIASISTRHSRAFTRRVSPI